MLAMMLIADVVLCCYGCIGYLFSSSSIVHNNEDGGFAPWLAPLLLCWWCGEEVMQMSDRRAGRARGKSKSHPLPRANHASWHLGNGDHTIDNGQ